ncbi:MAG TPA: hypothetical protein VGL53_30095 [Bryobacteraceae bacterium]
MSDLCISFHGGSTASSINNILSVIPNTSLTPVLAPNASGVLPALSELRGFFVDSNGSLFVVNAYKDFSNILTFQPQNGGGYTFDSIFAAGATDGLAHPFCAVAGGDGHIYVSNQDVLSGASSSAITYYEGPTLTHPGKYKGVFIDGFITLRGIATDGSNWFVADEGDSKNPGTVAVYDKNGELKTSVKVNQAVHLLYDGAKYLYIGSEGDNAVYQWDPAGDSQPVKFVSSTTTVPINHTSGLAISNAYLFVASRKSFSVNSYQISNPAATAVVLVSGLADDPEFILYM